MGHHYISEIQNEKFEFTSKSRIMLTVILVIGLALAGIGAMKAKSHWAEHKTESAVTAEHHQPEGHAAANAESHEHQATSTKARGEEEHTSGKGHHEKSWLTQLWANILLNSYYFMLFTIGALFFIAVNYAANAGWSTLVKRVAEAITGYLPVAFITLTAVVIFGKAELYHWYQYLSNFVWQDMVLE
jgi:Flp pilus assembly protein TadB